MSDGRTIAKNAAWLIRAIAAGSEEGRRLLSAALRLKVILIPVAILASLAFVIFGRASQTIVITTAIATLVMSADALSLLFYGALRGRQRLQFEAAGMF